MFMAVALLSLYTDSPLQKKKIQLSINRDIQLQVTIQRNVETFVLRDLRGTHKSRELYVMYLIDFILLSYLQLIRPLYELFLEIIKAD
jgi:hypothetical protein